MANKKTLRAEGLERNGIASRSNQATLPPRSWRHDQPQRICETEVIARRVGAILRGRKGEPLPRFGRLGLQQLREERAVVDDRVAEILGRRLPALVRDRSRVGGAVVRHHLGVVDGEVGRPRSEEHTSELQSRSDLVCRLLLEKKKYNFGCQRMRDA